MARSRPEACPSADYIIVGAGSAGCVLASRLSEEPHLNIILVEAGGDDRLLASPRSFMTNLNIRIPAGFAQVMTDPTVNWGYSTEPDPSIGGRVIALPRGKVLGGSSSINGITYIRGLPSDYDQWRQRGCEGWGWTDVLPFFRKAERQQRGADAWHGGDGPVTISDPPFRAPIALPVQTAFAQAGVPMTDDLNGAQAEGVTFAQAAIHRGRRQRLPASGPPPAQPASADAGNRQAHHLRRQARNRRGDRA